MKRMIPISSLELSEENPRLNVLDTTLELITVMLDDQQQKLFKLAEDILIYGLNPLDTLAVYPIDNNKFKVAEGNRRVAALIILDNPDIIKISHPEMHKKFKQLIENSLRQPPLEIECLIFDSFEDPNLQHWIEIRHLGVSGGRGIDSWNSIQKERYRERQYGTSSLIDFWKQLEEKNILSNHQIVSISKTVWERILGKKGMTYLGLERTQRNYIIPSEGEAYAGFVKRIQVIADKLANKTVAIVYDKDKIQKFLDEVNNELYGEPLSEDAALLNLVDALDDNKQDVLDNEPIIDNTKLLSVDVIKPGIQSDIGQPETSPIDVFSKYNSVIPSKFVLRTSNNRIANIIKELKTLDIEAHPNSCGALCRLLFELSAKHYISTNNLCVDKEVYNIDFLAAINMASNHLKAKGKLSNHLHSALSLEKDHIRLLFNGYMHNSDVYPSSIVIKNLFKAHKEFIQLCLEK